MKQLKKSVLFCLGLGTNLEIPSSLRFEFTYELLYQLVGFEPVSIRGAVMSLKEESAVSVYQRDGQTRIQLTSVGVELLKALFPALKHTSLRKERSWTICIFKEGQSNFRPLRAELEHQGFYCVQRGMFVFPGAASLDLTHSINRLHMLHKVLIFESRRLVVGDEADLVRSLFDIKVIGKMGAVISKSLTGISLKAGAQTKLHSQTRGAFISLVPELMLFLAQDLNVPEIYFPQEVKLAVIKQLLFQVSAEILPKLLLQ